MVYRERMFWKNEEERIDEIVRNLSEKEKEWYLEGYRDAMKFWFGMEKQGLIDVHIGKRSGLLEELDDTD